ncbi:C2H2 type zinc-finger-domain-containing protein [Triangularia verruculosa]|uniref:C2H2 type zinc-finger-domain-containing protein n=1 Tax=Triangularia verruculosa TaxID=2587418 RepID=A0AAN6XDC3_9PEZI|nr:C2H2 type zinc-finger-domain-containing protein [Triangularia verruculosa]
MPDTAAATTTTTATANMALPSFPTSLPSGPETESSQLATQPFILEQCLFCPHLSATFLDSVEHMQKSHGLFIPHRERLAVEDLEGLFEFLHLIIFEYQECIKCGTTRTSVQGVQQHMLGKPGHCAFDISEPGSEFAEFYQGLLEERKSDDQGEEEEERIQKLSVQVDEDSLRLPSGRIISKKPSVSTATSFRPRHHRNRTSAAAGEIEYGSDSGADEEHPADQTGSETAPGTQLVSSKREQKRARAMESYRLTRMSASDRNSLMHLPVSQQRALLATQQRHQEKLQTEERRQRAKIDRKGNKNLYAYWNTETPVYLCG